MSDRKSDQQKDHSTRREFLKTSAGVAAAATTLPGLLSETVAADSAGVVKFDFVGSDSLYHGKAWETLNPGYWQIKNNALRRRLKNVGDRARRTGFPFHAQTRGGKMETDYDPSLPEGILYRRDLFFEGSYTVEATFTYLADRPEPEEDDNPAWSMFQSASGRFGLAIGAKCLFESYNKIRHAIQVQWADDGRLEFVFPNNRNNKPNFRSKPIEAPALKPGDQAKLRIDVVTQDNSARVTATFIHDDEEFDTTITVPKERATGYCGIVGEGTIDFEVNDFTVTLGQNEKLDAEEIECFSCYPLGDTLKEVDGKWQVKFVSLFAMDGETVDIRIADSEAPRIGWADVPVAGSASIVNHDWRRYTAVVTATLPFDPSEKEMFYTVWKDGDDVTADTRIGTNATGPGTGMVGDVPSSGTYVGRLPRLQSPYRLCGLSCHAITSGLQVPKENSGYQMIGGNAEWQLRDQPTQGAYKNFEEHEFQILVWEDDVWYMELVLYPPSTDDAYKVVKNSICGPTSRWQMMRHWNVINPGDHDYGMDDVKGPEQIAIRTVDGLGQDAEYMRRNFQIVHHLVTGAEQVDPYENPKKWRVWKMPNRDFSLVVLDSRLWRSSQDVDIWDDAGWGAFKSLYDRTDPTRSLLGEEQFAWLQDLIQTDTSRLICLTGINGMHTIWAGGKGKDESDNHPMQFSQRDRVTADYAGWVKAGADRVLELLGSREGVATVYGDVHNGCIMKNVEQGIVECSFGPIGRSGGRAVIPGFGPKMKDVDGRDVEIHSLYHKQHANPKLEKHAENDPFYWNFLEMNFDTRGDEPKMSFRVRNMIDGPNENPRGGGELSLTASQTGRVSKSIIEPFQTLANADIRLTTTTGVSLRGTRSDENGHVARIGLPDLPSGTEIIATIYDGAKLESRLLSTIPVSDSL